MAKKKSNGKNFDGIVEESFNEGFISEPEIQEQPVVQQKTRPLTEKEQELQKILSGDAEALEKVCGKVDRATYYLTDLHRACIDILAHEEKMTKNKIIVDALEQYLADKVDIDAAKERVVKLAIKELELKIEEEAKGKG